MSTKHNQPWLALGLICLAPGRLGAQDAEWAGRWVNVDHNDLQMYVLDIELMGPVHRLMPAPQFAARYTIESGRVQMTMSDGSNSSLEIMGDSALGGNGMVRWVRRSGIPVAPGSATGTWLASGDAPMEMFLTLRSDSVVVLEVGLPSGSVWHRDTLQFTSPQWPAASYTVRLAQDTLVVAGPTERRQFVRRPWGCSGTLPFDATAPECRK